MRLIDYDSQPSAERYKPVILDTPDFGVPLFPSLDDEEKPGAALPSPMYPDTKGS